MFAYCNNNPISYIDQNGDIATWIIVVAAGIVVIGAVVGALMPYKLVPTSNDNSSETAQDDSSSLQDITPDSPKYENPKEKFGEGDPHKKENKKAEPLTIGDRVVNTLIGASVGLAVAGAFVMTTGAVAAIGAASAVATVGWAGASGGQVFATGALMYDFVAMVVAPFFGMQIDAVEYAN